jgi:antitoxin component YwqK of YwqJK toxin-antitoxin module
VHGPYKAYYPSGSLKVEAQYVDNGIEGDFIAYYESGQIKEKLVFEKNEENGPFIEYHKNGQVKWKGAYLNGDQEHGIIEAFDENGELIKKMDCDRGVCKTIWKKEGAEI